jgi:hypothetical protein
MSRKIITDFDKPVLAGSEYRSEPHGAMSKGASFIEVNSLYARALNGLFRFSAINTVLAQTHQGEGVGEVEKDGEGGGQAVDEGIQELEKYHDCLYVAVQHLRHNARIEQQADQKHLHHEIDQLIEELRLFGVLCQDLSDDSTSARSETNIYGHCQSACFLCLHH